ncbi:MAG: choice-of-anchor I family protein [Cytophagaceae bacterium]
MSNILKKVIAGFILLQLFPAYSQTLVQYWNFNNSTDESTLLAPSTTLVNTASIVHTTSGTSIIQTTSNTTGQGFETNNENARNSDAAGSHLRLNNPIGATLDIALPTTGYQQIVVKYVAMRSTQGAGTQTVEYTTDGSTYNSFQTVTVETVPTLTTLDFSSITAANNNANFKIRITFTQGGGGTGGNNRFDNLTLDGTTLGNDNVAPTVAFSPVNASINLAVNTTISLTFSEDIRLVSDAAITNANAASVIELKKDNASGTDVTFTATISNKVITITPSADLLHNTTYYVALKANAVEDAANNAIDAIQSISFTTIPVQTIFQAGDIVPVAYRMSSTGAGDAVAYLTFVNILPGTLINFTDTKFTTNSPAQCPGGLTWTTPSTGIAAGSVFIVSTDEKLVNVGTLTGSSFGLSSGGDQVIVYTGSNTNPTYITALSSNAWLTTNTSCTGSSSMLPTALTDGTNAISLTTAPDATSGNMVNAFYNGTQTGTIAELRTAILNPANWVGVAGGTEPQVWPSWAFPGPPTVVATTVLNQTQLRVVFNRDMDDASVASLANFTGIADLASIQVSNNADVRDTLILTFSTPFTKGVAQTLTINNVFDNENRSLFTPYIYTFTYNTTVKFDKTHLIVNEAAGTVDIKLVITNPSTSSVDLFIMPATHNTASTSDITFSNQIISLGSNETSKIITVPIVNDTEQEMDEYINFQLVNPNGCAITGNSNITLFIKDNDLVTPTASETIELEFVSRYTVANPNNLEGIAEIVAYDPTTKRLYTMSTALDQLDIVNFTDPTNPTTVSTIDLTTYGLGTTSVAVKNGIVAVNVTGMNNEQENGTVVFFDTDGTYLNKVTVGALPDMVTFTPNGHYVLTANEGQPSNDYSVDPEGSISIINIQGGIANLTQNNVTTLDFTSFNASEATLLSAGVRKTKSTSTLSQDLEPEYITVSSDSKKAWVTLQENNSVAEINLETMTITAIRSLGLKDYSQAFNGFDASDNNSGVVLANWPIKGFYMPDAIANYTVGTTTYLITANEGDEKEYANLNERTTVGAVTLDPTAFPNGDVLKQSHNLGRFRISNLQGDTDIDGDYDELYAVGARSFSIWNASTGALIYDSGSEFERITEEDPLMGTMFNADNTNNTFKTRSRAKGPEPEGVTVAKIGPKVFAFITLERTGGVMVYDITDPSNVIFTDYKNTRTTDVFGGDNGPEGIIYIDGATSPDGNHYIISANEMTGTLAIFKIKNTETLITTAVRDAQQQNAIHMYPNPNATNTVHFSSEASGYVVNSTGAKVAQFDNSNQVSIQGYEKGIYLFMFDNGTTQKLIVE